MPATNPRRLAAALVLSVFALTSAVPAADALQGTDATPGADRCASVLAGGTPEAGMADMGQAGADAMMGDTPQAGMPMDGMMQGSPGADMAMLEFDQMYIDMMIPHHAAIVAMAEAALPRLEDERLREIAQAIIDAQGPEIEELRDYREQFYGDPEPMPMPMDDQMMGMMGQMMPGMAGMEDQMAFQMDAEAQVAAICNAEDTDLAFIDLSIAHHRMAIMASEEALDQANNQEIRDFAQRVIDDQQRELDELSAIRLELYGSATPEAVGPGQ